QIIHVRIGTGNFEGKDCDGVERPTSASQLGGRLFNRSDKTIPAPGQSFYETWRFGSVPKRFPQPLNGIINSVIEINEGIGGPNILAQVFARNDPARLFQQNPKNLERLLLQADPGSVLLAQFSGLRVQFKAREA